MLLAQGESMENKSTIQAFAHCDGPCGVYDPASARVAAEAVQSMTKKMVALSSGDADKSSASYINTMSRYAAIKEEESQKCKDEVLVLWTDFSNLNTLKHIQTFILRSGWLQTLLSVQG